MPLKCGSESTDYQWYDIRKIDDALATMRRFGIPEISPAYQQLYSLRGKLMAQVGFKLPRSVSLIAKLVGLSPGVIKVWLDPEVGWFSEARTRPGAPPMYRAVTDEVAMAILKKELTPELEAQLLEPVEYYGE